MTLDHLPRKTREEVLRQRASDALRQGIITQAEHDYFLAHELKTTTLRSRTTVTIAGALLITLTIIALAMLKLGAPGITGAAIIDIAHNTTSTNITQAIVGLNITGTLLGEGNATILLDTPNGALLVGSITSDDGTTPRTDHASYDAGDPVTIEHAPQKATAYFDDGTTSTLVTIPFTAMTNGTLLIIANDNETLTTYRLPVIIGNTRRQSPFNALCAQACTMNATNGTLRITTTGDATVQLTSVAVKTSTPNRPPVLAVGFSPVTVEKTTAVNMSAHFLDPDGDPLYYTVGTSTLVNASMTGDTLVLAPVQAGNGTITVYASDLHELVHTDITLSVPAVPSLNTPLNVTADGLANTTTPQNPTGNTTLSLNTTVALNSTDVPTQPDNATTFLDCTNPDPNQRPLDCIQGNDTSYFKPEDIIIENKNANAVARLTPVGNLLITGGLIENTTGQPSSSDYALGYSDENGDFIGTVWIDTSTGDLHLTGHLTEANGNIPIRDGWSAMANKRGIILALVNRQTGDLIVRGNLVPYRRSIT